jgi:hypothetical protein
MNKSDNMHGEKIKIKECIHRVYAEDEGNEIFRNVGNYLPVNTSCFSKKFFWNILYTVLKWGFLNPVSWRRFG